MAVSQFGPSENKLMTYMHLFDTCSALPFSPCLLLKMEEESSASGAAPSPPAPPPPGVLAGRGAATLPDDDSTSRKRQQPVPPGDALSVSMSSSLSQAWSQVAVASSLGVDSSLGSGSHAINISSSREEEGEAARSDSVSILTMEVRQAGHRPPSHGSLARSLAEAGPCLLLVSS